MLYYSSLNSKDTGKLSEDSRVSLFTGEGVREELPK